jgi:hypothetical protein
LNWWQYEHDVSFAVVRNPWDRFISALGRLSQGFDFWIKVIQEGTHNTMALPQSAWIARRRSIRVDRIFRFEDIILNAEGWKSFCQEIVGTELTLEHKAKTLRRSGWRYYYNRKTFEIIRKHDRLVADTFYGDVKL